jgi:hypothetical protein
MVDRKLLSQVLGIFLRTVFSWQRRRGRPARLPLSIASAERSTPMRTFMRSFPMVSLCRRKKGRPMPLSSSGNCRSRLAKRSSS